MTSVKQMLLTKKKRQSVCKERKQEEKIKGKNTTKFPVTAGQEHKHYEQKQTQPTGYRCVVSEHQVQKPTVKASKAGRQVHTLRNWNSIGSSLATLGTVWCLQRPTSASHSPQTWPRPPLGQADPGRWGEREEYGLQPHPPSPEELGSAGTNTLSWGRTRSGPSAAPAACRSISTAVSAKPGCREPSLPTLSICVLFELFIRSVYYFPVIMGKRYRKMPVPTECTAPCPSAPSDNRRGLTKPG